MSYYLHCYKSALGWPDLKEAKKVVEVKEEDHETIPDPVTKKNIASNLVQFMPTLESPETDFDEIAELYDISVEQARKDFAQIDLHTAEGEIPTQITIFDNVVAISVPFGYSVEDAKQAFFNVDKYTKIIRTVAGYFVYDPQTGYVYDPSVADFDGLLVYLRRSGVATSVTREKREEPSPSKKPWWKMW